MFKWMWHLTGGRPMKRIEGLFVDIISNKTVSLYQDKFNRTYMAEGKWDLFRVDTNPTVDD